MSDQDRPHEPLDAAAILERSIFAIGRTLRRLLASTEPGPTSVTLAGFWELITIRDLKACRASDLALAMNLDASTISRQILALPLAQFNGSTAQSGPKPVGGLGFNKVWKCQFQKTN